MLQDTRAQAESANFAGFDPYDALNSPIVRLLTRKSKWARIVCTQAFRRCPINLRPLLGIPRGHNPKALGLFLGGYSRLHRLEPTGGYQRQIGNLLDLLAALRSRGYSGNCWGYNFDWQSRTVFRPKETPTVVNSAFIGHALLDCLELTGSQRALDLARPIRDFVLTDLNRTPLERAFCFSYTPIDREVVHNANLLGASLLIRLNRYWPCAAAEAAALSSLEYSLRHQRPDGSWFYADTPSQRWIDSFHTGFNLQALRYFLREGYSRYCGAYQRGVRYYAETFFLPDGTPKYYHDRIYPIDIHAPTQAIFFFAGLGDDYRPLTEQIVDWTLQHLYDGRGRFYFRKYPWFTNRVCYMRWCQAWAFHALAEFAFQSGTPTGEERYSHKPPRYSAPSTHFA